MTNILVTGAAGFVGRHFTRALAESVPDATIIGLDRRYPMPGCHEQVVCDLSEPHALSTLQALDPTDYVVHFAAQSHVHFSMARPDIYVADNVLATSNLVQALAGHTTLKRFLQVSSCEVYGNTHYPPPKAREPGHGRPTPRASWPRSISRCRPLNISDCQPSWRGCSTTTGADSTAIG